jgi:hypothetical protein
MIYFIRYTNKNGLKRNNINILLMQDNLTAELQNRCKYVFNLFGSIIGKFLLFNITINIISNNYNIFSLFVKLLFFIFIRNNFNNIKKDISFILFLYSYVITTILLMRQLNYVFDIPYFTINYDNKLFATHNINTTSLILYLIPLNTINWFLIDMNYNNKINEFILNIVVYSDFIFCIGSFSLVVLIFDTETNLSKNEIINSCVFLSQFIFFQYILNNINIMRTVYVFVFALQFLAYINDIYYLVM